LGVSRQTISKWETDETIPDIYQSKKMAMLYKVSLDELIDFNIEIKEIQEIIKKSDEKAEAKIDWTKAWAQKYQILVQYQDTVNISNFASRLNAMLDKLRESYNFSEQDAVLVLKDILYIVWKNGKSYSRK